MEIITLSSNGYILLLFLGVFIFSSLTKRLNDLPLISLLSLSLYSDSPIFIQAIFYLSYLFIFFANESFSIVSRTRLLFFSIFSSLFISFYILDLNQVLISIIFVSIIYLFLYEFFKSKIFSVTSLFSILLALIFSSSVFSVPYDDIISLVVFLVSILVLLIKRKKFNEYILPLVFIYPLMLEAKNTFLFYAFLCLVKIFQESYQEEKNIKEYSPYAAFMLLLGFISCFVFIYPFQNIFIKIFVFIFLILDTRLNLVSSFLKLKSKTYIWVSLVLILVVNMLLVHYV